MIVAVPVLTYILAGWVSLGFAGLIAWNVFRDWAIRQSIERRHDDNVTDYEREMER